MKQKIAPILFCVFAHSISPLEAEEASLKFQLQRPSAIDKCMDDEKALAIDYSMHPYYLRLDLNGDGKMEYVLSMLASPDWKHHGLMVCHESGSKTIYRGIANKGVAADDKVRIAKTQEIKKGIIVDAVLIEDRPSDLSSKAIKGFTHGIIKCCYGRGKLTGQLIFVLNASESSQAIPLGITWRPLSKSEVLRKAHSVPRNVEEIAGEIIESSWHVTTSLGFMQGGQFRWIIYRH